MNLFRRRCAPEWALVPALVMAFVVGAGSGVTFAAYTSSASSAGLIISTKKAFPILRGGPAWVVQDISAGGAGVVADDPLAINNDNRFPTTTGTWPAAFAANEYLDFDLNSPLPGGVAVTGATLNYSWRTIGGGASTTCVQFETRNKTTNTIIATHPFNAADCTGGGITTTVALPELTSSDIANGVRIRVYHRNTAGVGSDTDIATVTGTAYTGFTLYPVSSTDASVAVPVVQPWAFAATDGTFFTSASTWPTAVSTARYLRFTYPGYVPAAAVVTGATFTHTFRGLAGGLPCYSLDVYNGATLLASHGAVCNVAGGFQTTVVPLPEINTVAEANAVVVRMYVWTPGSARKTEEDLASVAINYYID